MSSRGDFPPVAGQYSINSDGDGDGDGDGNGGGDDGDGDGGGDCGAVAVMVIRTRPFLAHSDSLAGVGCMSNKNASGFRRRAWRFPRQRLGCRRADVDRPRLTGAPQTSLCRDAVSSWRSAGR